MSAIWLKIKQFFTKFISTATDVRSDRRLLISAGVIIIFGIIMLFSASGVISFRDYDSAYYLVSRQIIYLIIGLVAFTILANLNYNRLRRYAGVMLCISIVLLVLVFIPGLSHEVNGSRSWINIFGFSLQPSEFVKLTFLIYLSAFLAKKEDRDGVKTKAVEITSKTKPFFFIFIFIATLMLLQPDLGTLLIISAVSLTVYFIGGGPIKNILLFSFIGFLLMVILMLIKPYQMNRFRCVVNPSYDLKGSCYQINQSLIAVGSGGFFGRGLGNGQQKFLYIPEIENDFIFAVIAEETGLLFSSILLIFYIYLFWRGYKIAKKAPDEFGTNLATGITIWLVSQVIINIGGVTNMLPMTGVPLPFISYGGSAAISGLMALGILTNISKHE